MKLKLFTIGLGIATVLTMQSCKSISIQPSEEIETSTLSADTFASIEVATPITVNITQGELQTVEINCPTNLVEFLEVNVSRGTLFAELKSGINIKGSSNISINLTTPRLTAITTAAASQVNINGTFCQDKELFLDTSSASNIVIDSLVVPVLDIETSSASHVRIAALNAKRLDVEASSASSVSLAGNAGLTHFEASSAASIHAKDLTIDDLSQAEASSAAHINLH